MTNMQPIFIRHFHPKFTGSSNVWRTNMLRRFAGFVGLTAKPATAAATNPMPMLSQEQPTTTALMEAPPAAVQTLYDCKIPPITFPNSSHNPAVKPFVPRPYHPKPARRIFTRSSQMQFEFRPLVLSDVRCGNDRRVRVAVANPFDMDMAVRFAEAQFEHSMFFEQGMDALVDDVEVHLYYACKRALHCPFSLIAFDENEVVGLLLCSTQPYETDTAKHHFQIRPDYSEIITAGPYRRRRGNRVKAFEDILLNEFPFFVDPNTSIIGRVEHLIVAEGYADGTLAKSMLREAMRRARDTKCRYVGALCSTDVMKMTFSESGFNRFLDLPYSAFYDGGFRGPDHLMDPDKSTRMTLMIARTDHCD